MRESQLDELCRLQQIVIFEPYSKSESKTQEFLSVIKADGMQIEHDALHGKS